MGVILNILKTILKSTLQVYKTIVKVEKTARDLFTIDRMVGRLVKDAVFSKIPITTKERWPVSFQKLRAKFDEELAPAIKAIKKQNRMVADQFEQNIRNEVLERVVSQFTKWTKPDKFAPEFLNRQLENYFDTKKEKLVDKQREIKENRMGEIIDRLKNKNGDIKDLIEEFFKDFNEQEASKIGEQLENENASFLVAFLSELDFAINFYRINGIYLSERQRREIFKEMLGLTDGLRLKQKRVNGKLVLNKSTFLRELAHEARGLSKKLMHEVVRDAVYSKVSELIRKRSGQPTRAKKVRGKLIDEANKQDK